MNKRFGFFYSLILILSLAFTSCGNSNSDLVGNWVATTTDFAGMARSDASSFVIGNKLYIFGGYNGKTRFSDLWSLDVSSSTSTVGSWTQLAPLDSTATIINSSTAHYARSLAVGFSIGTLGYIGTGYDGTNYMKDFWEYDPSTNEWTQIADFIGTARCGSYSFALNSNGYVGGGTYDDNYLSDFYKYDPSTKAWTTETSVGKKRAYASTFVIGSVAYLVGGVNSSGYPTDFWAFDGTDWTAKRQIANVTDDSFDDDYNIIRQGASTFVLNGLGYITCGNNGVLTKTTWEYNPSTDIWTEKTGFEKTVRMNAISATVNGRCFVMIGKSGTSYLEDINEFFPTADYDSYD